jgi:hypothetical protein
MEFHEQYIIKLENLKLSALDQHLKSNQAKKLALDEQAQ